MSALTKRQKTWTSLVRRDKHYPVIEALSIVKQTAVSKFDESIDVAVNLGIDPRKSDQ